MSFSGNLVPLLTPLLFYPRDVSLVSYTQSTHRAAMAMATFWRTVHSIMMEKIAQRVVGSRPPPCTLYTIIYKVSAFCLPVPGCLFCHLSIHLVCQSVCLYVVDRSFHLSVYTKSYTYVCLSFACRLSASPSAWSVCLSDCQYVNVIITRFPNTGFRIRINFLRIRIQRMRM
jgi:hypothetical protein